jgi:hypothetical protein
MTQASEKGDIYEFRVSGDLDRHAAEALRLEVRRFANQHGVELVVRVEKRPAGPRSSA